MKFSANLLQIFFGIGPAFFLLIISCLGVELSTSTAAIKTAEAGTGTGPDVLDRNRNRLVWDGSGNQFGDITSPSTISKTTQKPGPVTCTQIGYMADPASSSYYYDCELNPLTGKFEATKMSCPAGTKFQVSPPQCVRF